MAKATGKTGGTSKKAGASGKKPKGTGQFCSKCMSELAQTPRGLQCTNTQTCGRLVDDRVLRAEMRGIPANTGQKRSGAGKSSGP